MERSKPQKESERCREIPIEVLQEILLRLPTKDIIRSSCVSKLWHSVTGDPSFRKLHGADHLAAPSESEVLVLSEDREPGTCDEISVFNLWSGKAMCHVAIPSGYSLVNICNGLLCFELGSGGGGYDQPPPVVCNPITGEKLELPKPPVIQDVTHLSHRFFLGFSPPTKEYKMFRFSFSPHYSKGHKTNHIAVYTLGGTGGWRQYSYLSRFCPLHTLPPPVHIDGNLYVPMETGNLPYVRRRAADVASAGKRAAQMVVLNVATETRCTYRLPYNYDVGYHVDWQEMLANGFEMKGQMCLAVEIVYPRRKLQFWVMTPPGELEYKDEDKLYWDLRYTFDMGAHPYYLGTTAAWFDHDQMLCYRHVDSLYKHDTKGDSSASSSDDNGILLFDQQLKLPEAPSSVPSCQWNIYGGYRPSFLSPLTFALPPSQDQKAKKRQFEHSLIHGLKQSKHRIKGPGQLDQHE